jgi:hypothetical protein
LLLVVEANTTKVPQDNRDRIPKKKERAMALMRGEPLVKKLALLAKYVVLPGAMVAALVYSPPDYASSSSSRSQKPSE